MHDQRHVQAAVRERSTVAWLAVVVWASCAPLGTAATTDGLVLSLEAPRNAGDRFDPQAAGWADTSGSGRSGRLVNYDEPTWVGSGKPGDPYCLRLNGMGNYVEVPNPDGFDTTGGFSIEALARVRQSTLSSEEMAPLLACGGMGTAGDFNLQVRSGPAADSLYLNTQLRGKAGGNRSHPGEQ